MDYKNLLRPFASLVLNDADLSNYNTYKIASVAKYLILPNSVADLRKILRIFSEKKIPFMILGNGSNIILKEKYINKAVISLKNLMQVEYNKNMVFVSAGVMLPNFVNKLLENGYTGYEWAAGIPGTIGGSIVGNAGAYGSSIFDNLVSVTILNKYYEEVVLSKEEINYSYRYSGFKDNKELIIVGALFKVEKGDVKESQKLIKERMEKRKETQPLDYPSAGSVFRNPEGDAAGRLIDECGLKGYKIGGAEISKKHANFIINKGGATSDDIINLIILIKEKVKEKFNIDLILEQEIIN